MIERTHDLVELLALDDQRWGDEERGLLTAGSDHDVGVEHSCRDSRGKGRWVLRLPVTPVPAVKFDGPVEATSVDPSYSRMRLAELSHLPGHVVVELTGPLPEPIPFLDADMGGDGRNLDWMGAVARVRLPSARLDPLENIAREDCRSSWRASSSESFTHCHYVRPRLPCLKLEPSTHSPEPGHSLVCDPEGLALSRKPRQLVLVGRLVVNTSLAVVNERCGAVRDLRTRGLKGSRVGVWIGARPNDSRPRGRRQLVDHRESRRSERAVDVGDATVPVRLDG